MNLELTRITPEIRAAISAIAQLSGAPVTVRETIVIETPDPDLHDLLRLALKNFLAETIPPGSHTTKMTMLQEAVPPPARLTLEPRICEACGQTYQPIRKDQKYCPCKKNRKPEATAETDPLVPSSTPPAPGGLITWTLTDGPRAGQTMTSGQLGALIALGEVSQGQQLTHSTRGRHQLAIRKGRLTPVSYEPAALQPGEPTPVSYEPAALQPGEPTPATEPQS